MLHSKLPVASLLLAATFLGAASAHAMTADEYLTRAQALKAKGMMALLNRTEMNTLLAETKAASDAYVADLAKAQAKGDTTALGCPPAPGSPAAKDPKNGMSMDQFLGNIAGIPKDQRQRMTFKAAYYDLLRKRWPCPAK